MSDFVPKCVDLMWNDPLVISKLSGVVRNTSVLLYPAHYGPSVSRNLSFSLIILCIFHPVCSAGVRFVILHIIALCISHLLFLLIQFVLNYYHSW